MNNENNTMSLGMRLIAKLIIFVYLFQISFNSYASILSNANVQYQLDTNLLFELLANDRDFLYGTSDAVVTTPPPGMDIESFYRAVEDNRSDLLKDKTYIPIISGNITSFIPINILDKTVGPAFVQSRLVRTQVKNLLGRNLINQFASGGIYVNETAQLNTLYGNALDLLKNTNSFLNLNYNLEFGLPLNLDTENSGLEKDIIWPEFRELHGQTVLVPVVYLTKTTYDQFRVDGHTIQFAGNASFDNLNIENSTVRFERDAYLNVAKNLISTSGAIIGNGDLDIVSGGVLHNVSSLITSVNGDLTLLADRIESRTLIHRYDFNGGHSERFGDISGISANGDVTLRAYSDILISGTEVVSENESIRFAADGNIYIVAQSASSESSRRAGGWRVNQRSSVDYLSSTLNAEDAIELIANGNILIDASEIIAGNGHIEILAGLGITVQDELSQYQSYQKGKFGKTKVETSTYKTVAIRSLLDAGKNIVLNTEFGDISLRAADISSESGLTVTASNGSINLLMAVETDHYTYNSITKKLFTVRTVNKGRNIESAVPNTIVGGVSLEALYGINVEYEGNPDLPRREQIEMLAEMPGLEWMSDIESRYPDINWQSVDLIYEEWSKKSTSLSPAALAVITIVVAIVTAGQGAIIVNAAAGAQAVAANAAFTSLVTTAAVATGNAIANGGDPIEVLNAGIEAVVSREALTSAATSAITAAAIAELDATFFDQANSPFSTSRTLVVDGVPRTVPALSLTGQVVQGVSRAAVTSSISSIINGSSFSDFGEAFGSALVQNAINSLGNQLSLKIANSDLHYAVAYIANASVGCLAGALSAENSGSDPESACATAAGASLIDNLVDSAFNAETDPLEEKQQELADWLEENIEAGILDLTDEEFDEYVSSGTLDPSTIKYVAFFKSTREQLAELTTTQVNTSRVLAGLGAFIAGANAESISIADNVISYQQSADQTLNRFRTYNASLIYAFLSEQEKINSLGGTYYNVHQLIADGHIDESYGTDAGPLANISGAKLLEIFLIEEFVEDLSTSYPNLVFKGSSTIVVGDVNELALPVLSDYKGGLVINGIRRHAIQSREIGETLEFARTEIDRIYQEDGIGNRNPLHERVSDYQDRLVEIETVLAPLDYFGIQGIERVGAHAVESAVETAASIAGGIARAVPLSRAKKFVDEVFQHVDLSKLERANLESDIAKSPELLQAFKESPDLIDSWKILYNGGYGELRAGVEHLGSLDTLLKNTNLMTVGLNAELISGLIAGNRMAARSSARLLELTEGLNQLVSSGTKFNNVDKLIGDFNRGNSFAEGAGWIQTHLVKNVDEFSGLDLTFELVMRVGETTRRIDVAIKRNGINQYLEYKSVKELPPQNFTMQFINDLGLMDVTSLDQIRWIFDGRKINGNNFDTSKLIQSLNGASIPQSTIDKFIPGATQSDLIKLIDNESFNIFRLE